MFMGGVGLILVVMATAGLVLWIAALADALGRPASQWERAEQNQMLWVGVIVFANLVGALIYWVVGRPKLIAEQV